MATKQQPQKAIQNGKSASKQESKKSEMSKAGVDQELIRQLAALLTETDLSEIEIETDGLKLRVARQVAQAVTHIAAPAAHAPAAAPAAAEAASHPGAVNSPMVGTAYLAPEPGAAVFAQVGQQISEGQTVLIIEAMKTMNHIPAPRSGKLTAVLVDDGQPVEFGEPLFVIE